MKWLLVLLGLLLPDVAHAACVPSQATQGMLGCEPVAPSMSDTDYLQTWIPGQFPNSSQIIQRKNMLAGTAGSSMTVTAPGAGAVARTMAERAAECDAGGANCAWFNAKDYGITPANSAADNNTKLTALLVTACTAGGNVFKTIYFPGGFYPVATTTPWAITCQNVAINGDGQSTVFHVSGTGDAWTISTTSGFVSFNNIRMYRADNPTAGRAFLFQKGPIWFNNIEIDAAYGAVEIASVAGFFSTNVNVGGTNSNAGSYGLLVHRLSNVASNPSEMFLSNWNLRPTTQNALVLRDFDGFNMVNSHVGFSTAECFLHEPENTNDQLTGIHMQSIVFDGCTYGVHFAPLGGYTGSMGFDSIVASNSQEATVDGMLLEDPALDQLSMPGWITLAAQHNGVNIQAGKNISWSGGGGTGNNAASSTYADLVLAGSATSDIVIGGLTFSSRAGKSVQDHIQIADPVNHVMIGPNSYSGATGLDVNNTSAQVDIRIAVGSSDKSVFQWDWRVTKNSATSRAVKDDAGVILYQTDTTATAASSMAYPFFRSVTSGGAALYFCGDSAGTGNCNTTIEALGTGTTTIGQTSNTAISMDNAAVLVPSLPTSAPSTHCAIWVNSGVLTRTTCP